MFVHSGINLGAALAPLVAGSLHRREGYEAGFLSAAFGMAVCLVTYQGLQWVITDSLRRKGTHRGGLGTRGFRGGADDDVFDDFEADGAVRSRRGNRGVGGSNPTGRDARDHTTAVTSTHGGSTHGGTSFTFTEVCAKHKTRLSAMAAVCALSAGFWCAYEQQGNTTALFADQWVDLSGTPTEFVQSVNPVLILALTPAVTRIWDRQRLMGTEPTQVTKMAIGSMLCALCPRGHQCRRVPTGPRARHRSGGLKPERLCARGRGGGQGLQKQGPTSAVGLAQHLWRRRVHPSGFTVFIYNRATVLTWTHSVRPALKGGA